MEYTLNGTCRQMCERVSFLFVSMQMPALPQRILLPCVFLLQIHLFNSNFAMYFSWLRLPRSHIQMVFLLKSNTEIDKEMARKKVVDFYFWITFCAELTGWMWAKCKITKFLQEHNIQHACEIFCMEIGRQTVIYLYICLACMWMCISRVSKQKDHDGKKMYDLWTESKSSQYKLLQQQQHQHKQAEQWAKRVTIERVFLRALFPFSHAYNVDGFLLVNHFFHGLLAIRFLFCFFPGHSIPIQCGSCCFPSTAAGVLVLPLPLPLLLLQYPSHSNEIHVLQEFLPVLSLRLFSFSPQSFSLASSDILSYTQRFIYIIYMGGVNQIIP